MKNSKGVITLNSTTGFEALIKNIPVMTLGHEFYCKDNLTYIVRDLGKLSETLMDMINNGNDAKKDDIKQFVKTIYSNTIWINHINKNLFIISDADGKSIALALNRIFLKTSNYSSTEIVHSKYSTSPTGSENHLSPLRFQTFNRKVF